MSVRDWKSFVKSSVYREAFLSLQVELSMNRKTSHLSYSKLCTKDYLKQLSHSFARVVFKAKTRMLDIKTNYQNKYCENLKCPFCCVLDESFDHIFTCRFGIRVPREIKHFRMQSFGSEIPLPVLEKIGQFLKRYLKYRAYVKWLAAYNYEWYIICYLFLCIIMCKVFISFIDL